MKYTCPMHPEIQEDNPDNCPICGMSLEKPLKEDFDELKDMMRRFWISFFCTLPILVFSMSKESHPWMQGILATLVMYFGALPFFKLGWNSIKSRNLNMFTLISLGIGTSYLYSVFIILSSFKSEDPTHLYFEAASVITVLTLLGQVLELRARNKVNLAIYKLLQLSPKTARVIQENQEELDIPLDLVKKGDLLRIRPGELVPTDGLILEGTGSLNESMITGESFLVLKKTGDPVIGATLNQNGSFIMRAEKVGNETLLSRIIQKVAEAQSSRAPIQKLADRVSSYFVPIVIAIALITFIVWCLFSPSITFGLISAVSVLMIACPCALGLATPMSITVGIGQAALEGIFIKDGTSLESLSKVDTILFDKTGTITEGKPKVTKIECLSGVSEENLIQLAASLEVRSEHPLSLPIIEKAKEKNIPLLPVENFQNISGKGIVGTIEGKTIAIGNQALLFDLHIDLPDSIKNTSHQAAMYLASENTVLGFFVVADKIKTSAKEVVEQLHLDGIDIIMITGDHKATAFSIGNSLHINKIEAEVSPEGKSNIIKALQKEGKIVCMVGDGINDSPALALANVGIAMGKGSDIAIESAGISLLGGDLQSIIKARKLAIATMRNIRQNLYFAFAYNIFGIAIAAGILYPFSGLVLNPMIASIAMVLSSLSVILNSLRLRYKKTKNFAKFSIGIFLLLASSAYIFYKGHLSTSSPAIETCVEQMLPSKEPIIAIEKMKGGFSNDIWDVYTETGHYILREKTKKTKPSAFIKDLEMAKKAFEHGIGPEIIGVNIPKQQMLIKYIESIPWPSYEENNEPYKKTMLVLKSFHKMMPASSRIDKPLSYAPFDYIFSTGKRLVEKNATPVHFSLALLKTKKLFETLEPWIKKNATLCHGDFCKQNVLLTHDLTPILIDFDSVSLGDPTFDIAKFSLSLPFEQRLELFQTYLGKKSLSLEEVKHFESIDLSLLMLVATIRLQSALNSSFEEKLSKSEMETILNSKELLPSFRDVPFEDTSPKARQLGALFALSEFLNRIVELDK